MVAGLDSGPGDLKRAVRSTSLHPEREARDPSLRRGFVLPTTCCDLRLRRALKVAGPCLRAKPALGTKGAVLVLFWSIRVMSPFWLARRGALGPRSVSSHPGSSSVFCGPLPAGSEVAFSRRGLLGTTSLTRTGLRGWLTNFADQEPPDEVVRRVAAEGDMGEVDTSLAATALSHAYRGDVHLLTNDEELMRASRRAQDRCRRADTDFTGNLVVHPSPGLAKVLHACGAFPTPIVEACLLAEFSELHRRMEEEQMSLPTFRQKTSRLEKIAADLRLPMLEEEPPQLDDADIRRLLLGDDDEL